MAKSDLLLKERGYLDSKIEKELFFKKIYNYVADTVCDVTNIQQSNAKVFSKH